MLRFVCCVTGSYDDDKGQFVMTIGDHIAWRYEIVKQLGKGSFSTVHVRPGTLVSLEQDATTKLEQGERRRRFGDKREKEHLRSKEVERSTDRQ